ncbi:MAG: ATP-binding protein [Lachnospiraceae bacterium]|nr:ATP-binding protein [Lachnospiraceae bacterium]
MPLTNTQYDEIMRTYQSRQLQRQRLILERRREIGRLTPRMAELDAETAHVSVEQARRLLDGRDAPAEQIADELAAITARKKDLLLSLGKPADYFDPPYYCPDCRDTGYIGRTRCHCLEQASLDLIYEQSNLASVLGEADFTGFCLDYYADDQYAPGTDISSRMAAQNAYAKCRQFVKNFDTDFQNILLFGDTGVGKTFLSCCIAGELLGTRHSVIYFSAQQFFDRLAADTFRNRDVPDDPPECRNLFECDLLILDDLGTEMTNSFTSSRFFVCLNERILHRKSTIISSNLNLQDIASIYSERIFSRITSHFLLLHLFGKDIRVHKRFSKK